MDGIKDVPAKKSVEGPSRVKSPEKQRPISELTSASAQTAEESEAAEIEFNNTRRSKEIEFREQANQLIEAVHVAEDAAAEVRKFVESIGGIVEQAEGFSGSESPDEKRIEILEKEAAELVGEIQKQVERIAQVRPEADSDPIKSDLRNRIGKALEAIIPDGENILPVSDLSFSRVDTIINVRANVERARERVEQLGQTLKETRSEFARRIDEAEIAFENKSATEARLADVDKAFELTMRLKEDIAKRPQESLGAVGKVISGGRSFDKLLGG